ncbi:MAG TPA: iron-sulfur cluster assembly scaffold protein [Salinisphaeraceae bacterium]|nr:iron-sulfur cluster assembly scaffold protein [Salinisphaeraceae bacterium]
MAAADERLRRFLQPDHALHARRTWQARGAADTPGADALCEIYLAIADEQIVEAAFAAYGPPIVVACADWLCEQLGGRTIAVMRGLSEADLQAALALAAEERYAGMLVFDALQDALANLET